MKSVFDVIDALLEHHGYTMKELAERSGVPYTTLASMMAKKPSKISKNTLLDIADVFEVAWYEMLGRQKGFEDDNERATRNIHGIRLNAEMDEEDYIKVLRKVLGDEYVKEDDELILEARIPVIRYRQVDVISASTLKKHFRASINTVLERLSDEGVMEVMRHVLDIAQNPKYYAPTDQKTKEDTRWQNEEQ